MKALSIRHPWAWAILNAKKEIENRTWRTKIRGTVAVHASQTMRRSDYEEALRKIKTLSPRMKVPPYESLSRGTIIGVVDIVGCEPKTKSKWHARGHYGFILANPRALRRPIPSKASLSFWEVPENIAKRISRELKSRRPIRSTSDASS
jgi:hypothetical protein